jgi:hypothetical protein
MGAQGEIDLAAARAAEAKAAIAAKLAAEEAAKAAKSALAAKAKAEADAAAKKVGTYRAYMDGTAMKYPKQQIRDPAAIETSKLAFATGRMNDSNGPDTCSAQCNKDPSCRAFQYMHRPNDKHFGGSGGCLYFSHSGINTYKPGMITPPMNIMRAGDPSTDAYVITPSPTGTIAQTGFANDIAAVQKTIDMYKDFHNYTSPQYTKASGKDVAGNDIGRITGGSPDQCRVKCDADPKCQGFNYVRNTAPGHPSGTCFYKTRAAPLSNNSHVDFFTKKLLPVPAPALTRSGSASVGANAGTVRK